MLHNVLVGIAESHLVTVFSHTAVSMLPDGDPPARIQPCLSTSLPRPLSVGCYPTG